MLRGLGGSAAKRRRRSKGADDANDNDDEDVSEDEPAVADGGGVMKAAASMKSMLAMKRPAAAVIALPTNIKKKLGTIDMKSIFDGIRKDHHTLTRNAANSRAYDNAVRKAEALIKDEAIIKQFAREQAQHAMSMGLTSKKSK